MNTNLLVVGSYPPYGQTHHKLIVGGASYTRNTLLHLLKSFENTPPRITVIAEQFTKKETYVDESITVKRVWKRNGTFPLLQIFWHTFFSSEKRILFEFELSMFGGIVALLLLPLVLFLLKLSGKKIYFVVHQVIVDINTLSEHIGLRSSFLGIFINLGIKTLYFFILFFSTKIIVFDTVLQKRLDTIYKGKTTVIPHGVEDFKRLLSKEKARSILKISNDQTVFLYFGFLAWYKGADWIANEWKQIAQDNPHYKLILAGGPNPNHVEKKFYKNYIESLKKTALENNVTITGFVKETEIPEYFIASDVVLFPYREFMSASGPLSLAFSFEKPVLLSEKLSSVLETKDIKKEIEELHINKNEILFPLSSDFPKNLLEQTNKKNLEKLTKLSKAMKLQRDWSIIGQCYKKELFYE